jgi:Protein kinase domain
VDIYSLGAILYELLTGRPPFRAQTPLDTVLQVLERDPEPPRQVDPRIARDLETICLKCLEKDPQRRYESAAALAEDLGRWRCGELISARRISQFRRAVHWVRKHAESAILGLLGLGLLLATGAVRDSTTVTRTLLGLVVLAGTARAQLRIQAMVSTGVCLSIIACVCLNALPPPPPFRSHGVSFGLLPRDQQQYLQTLVWLPILAGVLVGNLVRSGARALVWYLALLAGCTLLAYYTTPARSYYPSYFPYVAVLSASLRYHPLWGPPLGLYWGLMGRMAQRWLGGRFAQIVCGAYVGGQIAYSLTFVFAGEAVLEHGLHWLDAVSTYGMLAGTLTGAWIGSWSSRFGSDLQRGA